MLKRLGDEERGEEEEEEEERMYGIPFKNLKKQQKKLIKKENESDDDDDGIDGRNQVKHLTYEKKPNVPGRGPPKKELLKRRIIQFYRLLISMGVKPSEIFGTDKLITDKLKNQDYKTWDERIPSNVLFGGIVEDRNEVLKSFKIEKDVYSKQNIYRNELILSCELSEPVLLFEHLEAKPFAYGISGMKGSIIQFIRTNEDKKTMANPDVFVNKKRYYPVQLKNDEPSPVIFDLQYMYYYYSHGFGMYPIFKSSKIMEENDEYIDYVVIDGIIRPIEDKLVFGQLEPSCKTGAPTLVEFAQQKEKIKNKTNNLFTSSELCYFRSTEDYQETEGFKMLTKEFAEVSIFLLYETFGLLYRMIHWSIESSIALVGETRFYSMNGDKEKFRIHCGKVRLMRALRFVMTEIESSPWVRCECFRNLFKEIGDTLNKFPIGTFMRVHRDNDCLISYSPTKLKSSDEPPQKKGEDGEEEEEEEEEEEAEDGINCDPADNMNLIRRSKKQKRSPYNMETKDTIGQTEYDMRSLNIPSLDMLSVDCSIPMCVLETIDRWDKVWILQVFAGSDVGSQHPNPILKLFIRDGSKSQKNNVSIVKYENIIVRQFIEKEKFSQEFRKRTLHVWQFIETKLLETHRYSTTSKSSSSATKDDYDDLDEFAILLGNQVDDNKPSQYKIDDHVKGGDGKSFGAYLNELTEKREKHLLWLHDRSNERIKVPKHRILKTTWASFMDNGTIDSNTMKVFVQYTTSSHYRMRILPKVQKYHPNEQFMISGNVYYDPYREEEAPPTTTEQADIREEAEEEIIIEDGEDEGRRPNPTLSYPPFILRLPKSIYLEEKQTKELSKKEIWENINKIWNGKVPMFTKEEKEKLCEMEFPQKYSKSMSTVYTVKKVKEGDLSDPNYIFIYNEKHYPAIMYDNLQALTEVFVPELNQPFRVQNAGRIKHVLVVGKSPLPTKGFTRATECIMETTKTLKQKIDEAEIDENDIRFAQDYMIRVSNQLKKHRETIPTSVSSKNQPGKGIKISFEEFENITERWMDELKETNLTVYRKKDKFVSSMMSNHQFYQTSSGSSGDE